MTIRLRSLAPILVASLMTGQSAMAQVDDWFFNKAISYRQSENNTAPTEADGWFVELAVVTLNPGDATSATISGGGIAGSLELEWDDGEWLYERDFESQAQMDALFPGNQSYTITLSGGTLGTLTQTFNLGPASYPAIPYLTGSDFSTALNILPGAGFTFHWNSPGAGANAIWLELEDAVTEDTIADFEFDAPGLPTSQHLDSTTLSPGYAYSGFLGFLNSTTNSGAGGFEAEGYIEYSTELSFDFHQLLSAAPDPIVGAWQFGDSSKEDSGLLVFQADGTYFHIEDPAPDSDGVDGVEMGTYSLNEAGNLTVDVLVDTNGDIGLSHPSGSDILTINGDFLSVTDSEETSVLTRVAFDAANPIVGAWRLNDNDGNNTGVLVFLDNGFYFHGEVTDEDPAGQPGMERGSYTLVDGNLNATPATDTNLELGLSHPIIGFDQLTITDNVSMRLFDGEDFYLRRVSNASILPGWRINKSRNFNQTLPDTAPTTPAFWNAYALVETRNAGDIARATLSGGGFATPATFDDEGEGEWTYDVDYPDQSGLDSAFPDSAVFTLTVSGGAMGTRVQPLNLGSEPYPPAPYLVGTNLTDAQNIDSTSDFDFTWNAPSNSATQLVLSSQVDEDGIEYFSESDLSGTATGVTIPADTLAEGTNGFGYLEFARGSTDSNGDEGFGVSGFSGRQSVTLDFPFATQGGDDGGLGDATADAGLTGEDALPNAAPFGDGVDNLLKFAFNMNLSGYDNGSLAPGGNSGLPTFELTENEGVTTFELNFIRRTGSPLVYTPQRGGSLDNFATMTGAVTVTPIAGGEFERVTISEPCDPEVIPRCFGRVLVTVP